MRKSCRRQVVAAADLIKAFYSSLDAFVYVFLVYYQTALYCGGFAGAASNLGVLRLIDRL